jgi:hypothetical protein
MWSVAAGHLGQIRQQPRPGMRGDPRPSVVTVTTGRIVVGCTYEVPSSSGIRDPQQVHNLKQARHFAASTTRVDAPDHIATATPGPTNGEALTA